MFDFLAVFIKERYDKENHVTAELGYRALKADSNKNLTAAPGKCPTKGETQRIFIF